MAAEEITTISIALGVVEGKPEVLDETSDTRLLFFPMMTDIKSGVRGSIVRYKKKRGEPVEAMQKMDFKKLKLNEGNFVLLKTGALSKLCDCAGKHQAIIDGGLKNGENHYMVGSGDDLRKMKEFVSRVGNEEDLKAIWDELSISKGDLSLRLSLGRIQTDRKKALDEFEESLPQNKSEPYWQGFFENNKWIFGYGLNYQILNQVLSQPNYGGTSVSGEGAQRGDYLTATQGNEKFTVLVEIKRSDTKLLRGGIPQRNGAWSLSNGLTNAVTQLQANIYKWATEGSRTDENRDIMGGISTVFPKGIIVIGNLGELDDRDKRQTFERFRQGVHGIEILTYDEVLERAKFILNND